MDYEHEDSQTAKTYTKDDVVCLYEKLQDGVERRAFQQATEARTPGVDLRLGMGALLGDNNYASEDENEAIKSKLASVLRTCCFDHEGKPVRSYIREIKDLGVPISAKGSTVTLKLDPDLGDISVSL